MQHFFKRILLIIIVLIGFLDYSYSQTTLITKVRGKVIDSATKETLPYVNITFRNTKIGAITDFKGEYFMETKTPSDSLIFSYIGYKSKSVAVQKNKFQEINIELESNNIELQEVVITPGKNPALILLDSIVAHKDDNNPNKIDSYQYEVYSKIELDVNNINQSYKDQRVFRKFQFIFDYIDTNAITGKNYLPVFISETLSDYFYNKNPKGEKEVIKANRISGLNNASVSQLTGNLYQNVNIYNNFINVFDKGFVSPINNSGNIYYKYYLIDSMYIDNLWCYQVSFKPRRKQEPTFTGDFWVHDSTFAIKKVQVRIAEDANINFLNDMVVTHEYERIENKVWFLKKEEIFVDFNVSDKTVGFFGRKLTTYKDIVLNQPKDPEIFNIATSIQFTDDAMKKDDIYWSTARHDSLTPREAAIYSMVDSIKKVPVFKSAMNLIMLFVTGYKVINKVEFGPYYTFFSFNDLEGSRVRIGARTSNSFSTKFMPQAFIAYGFKDEKIKYGGGFIYLFNNLPREGFGMYYKYDVEQIGQSQNAFLEDNILSSTLRRTPNNKLTIVQEIKLQYEKEWFQGFSNTLYFKHRRIEPTFNIDFEKLNSDSSITKYNQISTAEMKFNTRFAYKEKLITGNFDRMSLGTKYPILNLNIIGGIKGVFGSNYNYVKANFNFDHWFNINPIGWFSYVVDIGKIWGDLPYPLLQLHEGNETYAFDPYAFNLMNYYEFASDQYVSVNLEHHFEGFFLNHFPLLRKLKWREIAEWKGVYGSIRPDHQKVMVFPDVLSKTGFTYPYMEAGVGIENIFKIFRIDALWRLSYLDNPNVTMFGIRGQIQFIF
ncbi:MAG: hypothetical protein A2033_09415 [Bacteroidetes bacterium GWA2_31_9]|nr:MAG: hypothetical protein A2033_09415 [Bacteroidetes bacterium GWA2_31_9]